MVRRLKRVLSARVRLFVAAAAVTALFTVDAALAASKTFIGTTSHDWTNDTNWSPAGVPVATDDVAINAGKTADLSNTDAAINNLTLAGGTLTGTGTLTVNGTLTWSGGTMSGSGKTVAGGGLSLNGSGTKTLNRTLSNTGAATWTDTGNITIGTGGVLSNEEKASFTVQNDQTIFSGGTSPRFDNAGTFTKAIGALTTINTGVTFNNSGTVTVQSGTLKLAGGGIGGGGFDCSGATLQFGGGTYNLTADAGIIGTNLVFSGGTVNHPGRYNVTGSTTVSGGAANLTGSVSNIGALTVTAGTLNISAGSGPLAVPTLTLSGGTLTGSTDITVSGAATWSGGTMSGSGKTVAGGGLSLNGSGTKTLNRTLSNTGAATWTDTGNMTIGTGGVLSNERGASFTVQNDQTIFSGGTSPRFDNAGTFTKAIGALTTINTGVAFNNSGTVTVQAGTLKLAGGGTSSGAFDCSGATLQFSGGDHNLTSDATIAGTNVVFSGGNANHAGHYNVTGGTTISGGNASFTGEVSNTGPVTLSAGTLTVSNAAGMLTVPSLTISNGTLAGSSVLTVAGPLTWSGGAMSGTGRTVAAGGLTLNGTFKTLNRTLTNAGAATWSDTGDIYMGTGGVLNNQVGATFTAQNNQNVSWIDGAPHFDNAGTFVKDIGGGSTLFSGGIAFNNSGTVLSRTGTLSFAGGYQQSAGTTRLEGGALASYPALNIQGGKLEGSGLITGDVQNGGEVSPGSSPGLLTITGAYTQLPAGTFNVEIGGRTEQTQFDKLAISGPAMLDGALKVNLINGFRPSPGDAFQVMAFSGSSGDFSSTSGLDLGNGLILLKSVSSDAVTLLAAPPPSVTPTRNPTTPAVTPTPTPTASSVVTPSGCAGDCGGDGLVTVDELLTMINIALGNAPTSACDAGDINGDQQITVDEILAGVRNALNGCTSPHPEAVAGAVTTTVMGATGLSSLFTGIVSGFASATAASVQSAGASASSGTGTAAGNCPSGTATRTCVPGFGTVTMTITLSACTVQIAQGWLVLDGTVTLEGAGLCPDTIIPPASLVANVQATITDGSGLTTAIHHVNVTGVGSPHGGGPCAIDGVTLTLNGTLSTDIPGAGTVATTFHQTIVTLLATTFTGCVPTVYSETLDGRASLSDSLGGAFDVTFAQLTTTTDGQRDPTEITIDGGIGSTCIGRPVALSTISSLKMVLGEVCPIDGQIRVASPGGRSDIFYRSDGTVDIHAGDADQSFRSCRDAAFFVCSM